MAVEVCVCGNHLIHYKGNEISFSNNVKKKLKEIILNYKAHIRNFTKVASSSHYISKKPWNVPSKLYD